ncbi:MAG: polyribonucleotide nucleotidyltransferase, partial [Gammaproteobacteria bacterium]|nr:polyribonucleotide nucleotidyltransferase [Gammaproteobacteria bacterium]
MQKLTKSFQFGEHTVTIETGEIARQASATVMVNMADTVVMVAVVGQKEAKPGQSFFPLTVNYQEKFYAAGRIPGGFFKREGRPTEKETLTCRLIDRPIRPLFPKGFLNEVQVTANLISSNPEVDGDIPALIGTSAALALSGMPFSGPIGASKVGYINNEYVLNPSTTQLEDSSLNLIVAGTENAVLMVESEADLLPEDVMLGAVTFGHDAMKAVVSAINELVAEAGVEKWGWEAAAEDTDLKAKVEAAATDGLKAAYAIADKMERQAAVAEVKSSLIESLCNEEDENAPAAADVAGALYKLEKFLVRDHILSGNPRIDGRDLTTVR